MSRAAPTAQAQLARQLSWGKFMAPGGREKYRNSYLDGSWDSRREGVASTAGRPGCLWGRGTPKLLLTGPCHGPKQTHPTDGPLLEVRAPAGWQLGWRAGGGSQHCRATWASMESGNAQAPPRWDPATARSKLTPPMALCRSQGPCWSGMWLSWHLVHLSSGRPLRPRNCLEPGCAYSPGPARKAAELGKCYGPRGKGEI